VCLGWQYRSIQQLSKFHSAHGKRGKGGKGERGQGYGRKVVAMAQLDPLRAPCGHVRPKGGQVARCAAAQPPPSPVSP
jgi:hypothetical protein